jgi:predicted secreted Zn-dependent protease
MNRIALLFFGLILSLACNALTSSTATSTPAATAVTSVDIPNADIVYYDISGSTGEELRNQLDRYGLTGPDGYRGDAATVWHIEWTWDGYGMETCDLQTVTETHEVKVTMPRWIPTDEASPELIEKWGKYVLALANHEKGHVDNVILNIPVLLDSIRRADCTTAEGKAQEVLMRIRQYDLDYDSRTNHGETQGAVFP